MKWVNLQRKINTGFYFAAMRKETEECLFFAVRLQFNLSIQLDSEINWEREWTESEPSVFHNLKK